MLAAALVAAGLPGAAAARPLDLSSLVTLAQQQWGGDDDDDEDDDDGRRQRGPRREQGEARDRVRQGDILPLPHVLRNIARRTPGRLLDAGLENLTGRPVYRIRWAAADGRRIDFFVDARTGALLRADGD
jgi:uncharacterized membrane protein YkoI